MAEQPPSDPVKEPTSQPAPAAPAVAPQAAGPTAEAPAVEVPAGEAPKDEAPTPQMPEVVAAEGAAPTSATPEAVVAESDAAGLDATDQAEIDRLLNQASFEDPTATAAGPAAPDAEPFNLPSFQQVMQDAQVSSIDLLRDVELNVKIELGRNRMLVEEVLKLAEGSVVELDKLAGDPVDVFVNDRLVARGEVLVLNDNFCVRVNEIVAGAKEEGL